MDWNGIAVEVSVDAQLLDATVKLELYLRPERKFAKLKVNQVRRVKNRQTLS